MPILNMVDAINQALHQEMERDQKVLCFGEDTGFEGGVFRVTVGLQKKFGASRCFDTPLAEGGIVGFAIGLGLAGYRPVAEMQFSGFIYPGLNELFAHAARYRNRSRGQFSVPMVLRMPCGGGVRALEHHSESYEGLIANTPGLKCAIPSGPYEAKGLMIAAIRDPDPVVFMEPMRIYRSIKEEVPSEPYEIPLGKANIVNAGYDLTLVSWGAMVYDCKKVVAKLAAENISVELIDLRTPTPIDIPTILESVKKTGRLAIVHEAPRTCSVGAEISAMINERGLLFLKAPIVRVTGFDTIMPLPKTENYYMPSETRIEKGLRDVLEF